MRNVRRIYEPGARYFFTVVTFERRPILLKPAILERLRDGFARVAAERPFEVEARVILPDHLHCVWRLPEGDVDFSTRWRLVKRHVAVGVDAPANSRGEKHVWQARFWDHVIRDEGDWRRSLDYIHYNPVKHGYAASPAEWPHGTFREAVEQGWYESDWGRAEPASVRGLDRE